MEEEEEEEEEEDGEMDTTMDERDECFSSPCWEVDLDYEFSAPRFYDFTRLETRDESREAEAWFETADSYPPSPYLLKLHMRAELREVNRTEHNDSVHILAAHSMTSMRTELSPMDEETNEHSSEIRNRKQSTGFDYMLSFPQSSCSSTGPNNLISDPNSVDASKAAAVSRGMICDTGNARDPPRNRQKALSSAPSRISTLMKPTASQLAKQKAPVSNFSREVKCVNKISGRDINTHEKGVEKTSCNEFQASKRQKLEGGHSRKVQQLHDRKQQATLLHKPSEKNGCTENTNQATTLRLTVPREPKLETAQRARRIRAKNSVEHDEQMRAKAPLFKARPLNRKILEAPSLPLLQKSQPRLPVFEEFHLRTSERALQHSMGDSSTMSCFSTDNVDLFFRQLVSKMSTATTTSASVDTRSSHCPSNDLHPKSKVLGTTKHVINGQGHLFKATLLNKKILPSEGDFSIYQNSKREATKPMGFNFSTDKRSHQPNPPIELFNKLSLKSEVQAHYASQTIMHSSNDLSFKMCKNTKENERALLCREHMVVSIGEEERQTLKIDSSQATGDVGVAEMSCYTFL